MNGYKSAVGAIWRCGVLIALMGGALLSPACASRPMPRGVGPGIVDIFMRDSLVLRFVEHPGEERASETIRFVYRERYRTVMIEDEENVPAWFRPERYKPDYNTLRMRCREKRGEWLRVVIHEEDDRTLWIREGEAVRFVAWEDFLPGVYAVERLDPRTNPVRTNPDSSAKELSYHGSDCFTVLEVRGEWLRVAERPECRGERADMFPDEAWIRWRKGEHLLISYALSL